VWRPSSGARPEPESARELTTEELIDAAAKTVVGRGLAVPAVFLLESSKPLSFVASQGLVFLGPFVEAVLDLPNYQAFCRMMEDRDNVEKLIVRIEQLEDDRLDRVARERKAKKERRRSGEDSAHGTEGP